MWNEKGQTATEVIIIATVLLGLLLATSAIMVQRNTDAQRLSKVQEDSARCQSISAIVTGFSSNRDYSETKLQGMAQKVHIEKGSIIIGNISCRYSGKAWKKEKPDAVIVYTEDTDGFDLDYGNEAGMKYKAKVEIDKGVVFCDNEQNWC